MRLPITEVGLYGWLIGLMSVYLLIVILLNIREHSSFHGRRDLIAYVFDAATFAGSLMLLVGLMEPTVLDLIGSTKPFLVLAGMAGLVYSVGALFPRNDPMRESSLER